MAVEIKKGIFANHKGPEGIDESLKDMHLHPVFIEQARRARETLSKIDWTEWRISNPEWFQNPDEKPEE